MLSREVSIEIDKLSNVIVMYTNNYIPCHSAFVRH